MSSIAGAAGGRGHEAPLDYHRRLLEDGHRLTAYERALRLVVRPGDVVLDIGAGTGILALLAARLGAARVHAVESMPIAAAARALARANGLGDRVVVHQADLRAMAPVEPVDVAVGDFLGAFLADDLMLEAAAAAARWLKPGGRTIPASVELFLAPVGDFSFPAVDFAAAPALGVTLAPLRAAALAQCYRAALEPRALFAAPSRYLRWEPLAAPPSFDGELEYRLERAGRLRGLAGWFRAELADGVVLSTEPGVETHWAQLYFPHAPVLVAAGDVLACRVRLTDAAENRWAWSGRVIRGAAERASFEHANVELDALVEADPAPAFAADTGAAMAVNERAAGAYLAGDYRTALAGFEEAVRLIDPRGENVADVYENLGLAAGFAGRPGAAVRALLRALDGDWRSKPQALRFLVEAFRANGQPKDAERAQALLEREDGHDERAP